jgi:16S rRNA (cytosine1402-N4)-methyltransferase
MSKKKKGIKNKKFLSVEDAAEYDYHLPVMLRRTIDYLVTDVNGIYVDGTLGGGGHAAEILSRLSFGGKLLAFDKDEEAIEHCRAKFWGELSTDTPRIVFVNDSFDKACDLAERGRISGILLDLGLSSHQLDDGERGFSFRQNAPIDMRFGGKGESAETLLNASGAEELERIFSRYGEEPFSRSIARRIAEVTRATPIKNTFDLANIIDQIVPKRFLNKTLARVFQAIRIAVNHELDVLETTLKNIPDSLASGGRIVVLSYHSLEDRIVKNVFRDKSKIIQSDSPFAEPAALPTLKIITNKPIIADESELTENPRARSAKLRVAEKI